MPIVFRYDGFTFFFYSNEGSPREPVHVHVRNAEGEAKFWVDPVAVAESHGFNARTLRDLTKIVEGNTLLIGRAWHEHFG